MATHKATPEDRQPTRCEPVSQQLRAVASNGAANSAWVTKAEDLLGTTNAAQQQLSQAMVG